MLILLTTFGLALGADQPSAWTDVSATTVGKKRTRIGLSSQDYGLLRNAHVGVNAVPIGLGLGNVHAKVTAIQTPRFDLSIQGESWSSDVAALEIPGSQFKMTPIGPAFEVWRRDCLPKVPSKQHKNINANFLIFAEKSGKVPVSKNKIIV